jgi:hypothetical protein
MRGEIIGGWSETWREIWKPLTDHKEFGDDLIPDLYREFVTEPLPPKQPVPQHFLNQDGELTHSDDIEARNDYELAMEAYKAERSSYEEIVSSGAQGHARFRKAMKEKLQNEQHAIEVFEKVHAVVIGYGDDDYANRYFLLVEKFLQKYSLRYDLRRPFSLHPTLSGLFSRLLLELKYAAGRDAHLNTLFSDFEDALRDLKMGATPNRMKTCLQKQFNLLEAMGSQCPGVTKTTLGDICGELQTWPHATIREAAKKMYGFRSNYPGIGHGGNAASVIREIEMRDLIAVSILLAGFSPYLTDHIDSSIIFGGS